MIYKQKHNITSVELYALLIVYCMGYNHNINLNIDNKNTMAMQCGVVPTTTQCRPTVCETGPVL